MSVQKHTLHLSLFLSKVIIMLVIITKNAKMTVKEREKYSDCFAFGKICTCTLAKNNVLHHNVLEFTWKRVVRIMNHINLVIHWWIFCKMPVHFSTASDTCDLKMVTSLSCYFNWNSALRRMRLKCTVLVHKIAYSTSLYSSTFICFPFYSASYVQVVFFIYFTQQLHVHFCWKEN